MRGNSYGFRPHFTLLLKAKIDDLSTFEKVVFIELLNKQPLTNEINHLEWKITTLQILDSWLFAIKFVYLPMGIQIKSSFGHPKAKHCLTQEKQFNDYQFVTRMN